MRSIGQSRRLRQHKFTLILNNKWRNDQLNFIEVVCVGRISYVSSLYLNTILYVHAIHFYTRFGFKYYYTVFAYNSSSDEE